MPRARILQLSNCRSAAYKLGRTLAGLALATLIPCAGSAQTAANQTPGAAKKSAGRAAQKQAPAPTVQSLLSRDFEKFPGLLPELAQLLTKLQQNVQSPTPRNESRLLPLLPDSTMAYTALPNYGGAVHQALATFHQELQESAVLRDWWAHGQATASAPKIEQFLEQFEQLHQFLGDEIVLSGSMDPEHKSGRLLVLAEIRKPGLDTFLQQWITQSGGAAQVGVQVFDQQQFDKLSVPPKKDLLVLVRPDFVIATTDLDTLRSFTTRLNGGNQLFAATPFGKRVAQEYQGGATLLAAADVQKILSQVLAGQKKDEQAKFQQSGFADMQYAVWKQAKVGTQSVSQGELAFTGPRHGAAAWLASPTPLGSLSFVSPSAMLAFSLVLSSLPQIFDDIKQLSGPAQTNTFAAIDGGQKALNLSLKDDLLGQLSGEFTVEVDSVSSTQPSGKIIFKVNDAARLQKTLTTLLALAQIPVENLNQGQPNQSQPNQGQLAYHVLRVGNLGGAMTAAYAFVDGYWIIASKPEILLEAVQLHSTNDSLLNSQKFVAAFPAGSSQPPKASALVYQDSGATFGLQMHALSPELADSVAQFAQATPPSIVRVYGEESAIREQSNSASFGIAPALVVAAVAIPNLMRSRMAANEASAVSSLRTLNVAQVTYAATYPKRGFAPNLATLGSDPQNPTRASADHAAFVEEHLANPSCTGDSWCDKSGYQFRITTTGCSKLTPCKEYVAVATPVDGNTGTRSFCSSSDGVIHYKVGAPITVPPTVSQCRGWFPLK
jgi:type IV pilus assembly protein PilA